MSRREPGLVGAQLLGAPASLPASTGSAGILAGKDAGAPSVGTPSADAPNGFVLVCVLWVLVILTVITVSFGRNAVLERRAAAYTIDHAQALNLARGAVERGIVELRNKAVKDMVQQQSRRSPHTSFDQSWHNPPDLAQEGMFSAEQNISTAESGGVKDEVGFRIRDEESRISINQAPKEILDTIKALGVRGAGAILRERGEGETPTAKMPFLLIEELLTLEVLDEDAWAGARDEPGLRDLMTCWGDGKINVNTAPREVLEHIPGLGGRAIDAILLYRDGPDGIMGTADARPLESLRQIPEKTQLSPEELAPLSRFCKVDSQFFTITGFATRRRGKIRATCSAVVELNGGATRLVQWREDTGGS